MEMLIGCAPDWVESSKEIDGLAALCKMWWTIGNSPTLIMDLFIHYSICTNTKCISLSQIFMAEGLLNTSGYSDKFHAPYPTIPIFSNGHDFGHFGPFGQPAIIRYLIETNNMRLASLRNP